MTRGAPTTSAPPATAPTTMTTPATALVRRIAAEHGVDLATVCGSGIAGRITVADVRAAAPRRGGIHSATTAATSRPSLLVEQRSFWHRDNTLVQLDVYAANPLADDMRQTAPDLYAAARQRAGDPPTLFASGDLPLFTSSGISPALLMKLPWVLRHRAAAASTHEAAGLFETYGRPTPDLWEAALQLGCLDTAVLQYEQRMQAWAGGLDV